MPDIFDQYSHSRPEIYPQIYVFREPEVESLNGMLCIGFTTRKNVETRIQEEFKNAPIKQWETIWVESATRDDGSSFSDHDIHAALSRMGKKRLKSHKGSSSEWFQCTLEDVKAAILAVKKRIVNKEQRTLSFKMRPEQFAAVEKTKDYYLRMNKENSNKSPKFLWNAKMRFGKTFAAYELARKMGFSRILVLTFKPAVENAWEEDLNQHINFEGWQFYSKEKEKRDGITPESLDEKRPIVCFGSFQDFLGTNDNGGIKAKNEWVHEKNWDLVIFDEYHFGAWRENAKSLFQDNDEDTYDSLDIEKYKGEEADNAINESFLPITANYYLYLSGTPFRSLNNGEFIEDEIFSWTYSDEQRAKNEWKGPGENPYLSLPQMLMLTYRIPPEIQKVAINSDTNEFDLNEFFRAEVPEGKTVHEAEFFHVRYVQKWLDLIRGSYLPTSLENLKLGRGQKPVMPYSDDRMLSELTHTLWFLPNVASCYAMKNLLRKRNNVFYHDYTVNVCAGNEAGIGLAALKPVQESMEDPLHSKTITLSCGKLTTGITVKPWTGIFMLRNLSSPETYFQAAFRVQSPWTMKDEKGFEQIMKNECYVFDFSLNRALRQISDYSRQLNVSELNPEKKVADFIRFLPVLAYDGATMKPIDAAEILDITMSGTSATLLARRWQSALLVNVDNATLERLLKNPEALQALENIEAFRNISDDIETIINKSSDVKRLKSQNNKLTVKEEKILDEEEKEFRSKRKEIQDKLIKFATRIPIFMYLTDFREQSLTEVITKLEPNLFKKVTGITVAEFELLLSLKLFNNTLMNDAVYKFKRYEDASLEYAGIKKHDPNEKVGLFSTAISAESYRHLAKLQGLSLSLSDEEKRIYEQHLSERVTLDETNNDGKSDSLLVKSSKELSSVQGKNVPPEHPKQELKKAGEVPDWIKKGNPVIHARFGQGIITEVVEDGHNGSKITVRFGDVEKRLLVNLVVKRGILKADR